MADGTREFRDPIHGFIKVDPLERAIIDTFPFQRLRRISQLALTSYVYHGAEHSRFGHSLGVMHLAGRATELILLKNQGAICDLQGWAEPEFDERKGGIVKLARLAGLLHDVGHAPFSHAGERDLFPSDLRHEQYSISIVESDEIGTLVDLALEDSGFGRMDLLRVMKNEPLPPALSFLAQVISSPYDVDKMDYLLRDSHYCGVEYGTFDLARLISTLTLCDEDPGGGVELAIEEGGYHALEGLVLARYFMFTQVYFHKVRRAYDLVLTEFIQQLLNEQYGTAKYPADLDDYLEWNDSAIISSALDRSDSEAQNLAWMICNRRHPKIAYETLPHPDPMEARTALRRLLPEVETKFPGVRVWHDSATDHPERYRKDDIPIKIRGTPAIWRSFARTSEVLQGLQPIGQMRLYAYVGENRDQLNEIEEYCRGLMA